MNPISVRTCLRLNAVALLAIAVYFFLLPFGLLVKNIHDPSLASGQPPDIAYRWHQQLSDDFADWANTRTEKGTAANMSVFDVSGTEWPMYSAVFYLWATEALHATRSPNAQRSVLTYALPAVTAAVELVADPNNATWVKQYWGENYLTQQNIFYRMLLISGLTSYQNLTANTRFEQFLSQQVHSLAAELENSPFGLLDDYPFQCYPIDVLPAIAAIARADRVLGSDHSAFVQAAVRGFSDTRLDPHTGLPAYIANSTNGKGTGPARGVGLASMLIWAPELWPDVAQTWYSKYEEHFWQRDFFVASVREFSKHSNYAEWTVDVDAGPVFAGIGTAASAFGIGAARANGRLDQAYALSAEAMVAAWPLPSGTLLTPRLLSNLSDAPHVGEAALLFSLTRRPLLTPDKISSRVHPVAVYLGLAMYLLLGLFFIRESLKRWLRARMKNSQTPVAQAQLQLAIWTVSVAVAGVLFLLGKPLTSVLALLVACVFPRVGERPE